MCYPIRHVVIVCNSVTCGVLQLITYGWDNNTRTTTSREWLPIEVVVLVVYSMIILFRLPYSIESIETYSENKYRDHIIYVSILRHNIIKHNIYMNNIKTSMIILSFLILCVFSIFLPPFASRIGEWEYRPRKQFSREVPLQQRCFLRLWRCSPEQI